MHPIDSPGANQGGIRKEEGTAGVSTSVRSGAALWFLPG